MIDELFQLSGSSCNSRTLNPGISGGFANPESWDWQQPNPRISVSQKFVKK